MRQIRQRAAVGRSARLAAPLAGIIVVVTIALPTSSTLMMSAADGQQLLACSRCATASTAAFVRVPRL